MFIFLFFFFVDNSLAKDYFFFVNKIDFLRITMIRT